MKIHNDYYVPRNKKDLIGAIRPAWKGSLTDLREMSIKKLTAIHHRIRQDEIIRIIRGDSDGKTV